MSAAAAAASVASRAPSSRRRAPPAAAPIPRMPTTFSRPARRARSWSPPTSSGAQAQAASHDERADAERGTERSRRTGSCSPRRARRRRAGRGRRRSRRRGARPRRRRAPRADERRDVEQRAGLVVRELQADERGRRVGERVGERLGRHATVAVDLERPRASPHRAADSSTLARSTGATSTRPPSRERGGDARCSPTRRSTR